MAEPLLQVQGVWREYGEGDQAIAALRNLSLTIEAGEFVAIIGQSGSGKSTLMNILGCLDRPTRGAYRVAGRDTATLAPDELAALRREHFGFIFQRYHLLSDLDASGNVEAPAMYAGWSGAKRRERSAALLGRLGLADRLHHRPNQLSGGQQQRVSVARALMNGGEIILADEPTGALDTKSGADLLRLLGELNAEGHTIIVVTHDPKVAAHAHRIIEISDGEVISDQPTDVAGDQTKARELSSVSNPESWLAFADRLGDALRMALFAMGAHKLRSFLTMLGIIIGIASVVTIAAVGAGAKATILGQINSLGTNTLDIFPGTGTGDVNAGKAKGFTRADLDALTPLTYIDGVSPSVGTGATIRYGSVSGGGSIQGVGEDYFKINNLKLAQGTLFTADDVRAAAQVVVIDDETAKKLFPEGGALGQVILLGAVPARVIGVTAPSSGAFGGFSTNLEVYAPYTTVSERMSNTASFRTLVVKLADGVDSDLAQSAVTSTLAAERGKTDFYIRSSASILATINQVTGTLSLLIGSIGGISLVVGGIGVMNIMLVSVSERTKEIGVRTAIGARRIDIMSQFIIEAVLVCLIGGALGLGLSGLIGLIVNSVQKSFSMVYTLGSVMLAFAVATGIGLVFGWLPARNASRLDPVEALARD